MPDCLKCTTTPNIITQMKCLYVGFGTKHLYDKMTLFLGEHHYKYVMKDSYLRINQIHDFDAFIQKIARSTVFSRVEKGDLYLLPTNDFAPVDFGDFSKVHSLLYWEILYENADIVDTIKQERIKTAYQPIFENKTSKVFGFEALCRAHTADQKPIDNQRLFSVSKQLALHYNLDRQCRIKSIENAGRFRAFQGKLFINFSPSVIYDPYVCLKTTHETALKSGVSACDIVFEVVESDFVEDYHYLKDILDYYRKMGYQTALDDVGSGFSTLENYEILQTDYIKIDRRIISGIHQSKQNQSFINQIIALKENQNLKILAEGIETQEECDFISQLDIDYVQGYYFGKPSL